MKSHRAVDIYRRVSMIFYSNTTLDDFVSPIALTPEEVVIENAITEAKQELIDIIKERAKRVGALTEYQAIVLEGILANKTISKIATDLNYEIPSSGNYAVYVALKGYSKRIKSGNRVGGIYKRLRKELMKDKRVNELLSLLEQIKKNDYNVSLCYLRSRNPDFWNCWNETIL